MSSVAEVAVRHEILRSVFDIDPVRGPTQRVYDEGAFSCPVSAVDADGPDAAFDAERDSPLVGGAIGSNPLWHARLLVRRDRVVGVRLMFQHMIADGFGQQAWRRQLIGLIRGEEISAAPVRPIDRPRHWSFDPDARRRSDVRHVNALSRAPQSLLPVRWEDLPHHADLQVSVELPSALPMVDRICRAARVSRATVVKFVVAWLLGQYSRQEELLVANVVSPRAPGGSVIDCQMRLLYDSTDLGPDQTVVEALVRLRESGYSMYECDTLVGLPDAELAVRVQAQRGIGTIPPVYFNFLGDPVPDAVDTSFEPNLAVHSTISSTRMESCSAPIFSVFTNGDSLSFHIEADPRILSHGLAGSIGAVVAALLSHIVEHPRCTLAMLSSLFPDRLRIDPANTTRINHSWINTDSAVDILRLAPGVLAAEVQLDGTEIVADLRAEPSMAVFDVHEFFLQRLSNHRDTCAPTAYRVRGPVLPAVEWRPDRQSPTLRPSSPAERDFCAVAGLMNGIEIANLADCYVVAGGRLANVPAVVEEMKRRGYHGFRLEHFSSPQTMRSVVRSLTPGGRPHPDNATDGSRRTP